MKVLTYLIVIFYTINSVKCASQNYNIELILSYDKLHTNQVSLQISVQKISGVKPEEALKFNENLIYCLQSNYEDMSNAFPLTKNAIIRIGSTPEPSITYHTFHLLTETEGYIQCYYNDTKITNNCKSDIFFHRDKNTNIFVLKLKVLKDKDKNEIARQIEKAVGIGNFMASIKIPNTVHLTSSVTKVSQQIDTQLLNDLTNMVENVFNNNKSSEIIIEAVRSTRSCPKYENGSLSLPQRGPNVLFTTQIIDENNYPFTVKCIGDFYEGYHWNESDIQRILSASSKILPTASAIVSTDPYDNNFDTPIEIHNFAELLSNKQHLNASEIPELTEKINLLLSKDDEVFNGLRENLNTSNEILASLDKALVKTSDLEEKGFEESVRPNFAARVEDVTVTLGAGVAVIDSSDNQQVLSERTFVSITQNMTSENILDLAPRAALMLPASLLRANDTPDRLALSVFPTGAIFSSKPTSAVVSANLGGRHYNNLLEPVRIWFRRDITKNPEPGICVSWDFSKNKGRGDWSRSGCRLITTHTNISYYSYNSVLDECACWHLTHFGELFWHSDTPMMESLHPSHSQTLDFITLTGCCLSLAGLTGVFITAIAAPEWLRGSGQKIQLQISINLAFLIILFLVLSNIELNAFLCVFLGILLHYSMLSNFCWMLLAAYLQYSRLVKVVSSRSSRLPLKTGLIGWILPIVPCLCIIISGQYRVYSQPPMCLPTGIAFYSSILTPLVVVMCCNTVVFVLIARNLYVNIKIRRHDKTCLSFRRFKQMVFLFILLGLSWIFAIAQLIFPKPYNIMFSYLFCISIASKGLTYFVFFILMDESAKNAWRQRFCPSRARLNVKRYAMHSNRMTSLSLGSSSGQQEISFKPG